MSTLDMNTLLSRLLEKVADINAEADLIANQDKAFSLKADKGELGEYKVTSSQQVGLVSSRMAGSASPIRSLWMKQPSMPCCKMPSTPAASPRWMRIRPSEWPTVSSIPIAPRSINPT